MNKKIIGIIITLIIICAIFVIGLLVYNNKEKKEDSKTNSDVTPNITNPTTEKQTDDEDDLSNTDKKDKKVLVVYYSASNNTKNVAEKIATSLKADIFEIIPVSVYTPEDLDWTNENSRVSREHNDESLRNIKLKTTKVDNWDSYDTVLIGYPIWWGIAAWPVDNFIKENNFNGKTVIPFCTSASSGLGESGELLAKLAGSGNWLEGTRFSSSASNASIEEFVSKIN